MGGVLPPPGIGIPPQQEAHAPRPGSATAAFPPNFQPPPNINFSAPVIRLGTSGSAAKPEGGRDADHRSEQPQRRRAGLGSDFSSHRGPEHRDRGDRGDRGDRINQIQPQTKEEIIKTIFVGGITEGTGGDEGVERILRAAGNLRRWIRATDGDDKPCKCGFAEYEDPESLSTAVEVLRDVEVPVKRQTPKPATAEAKDGDGVDGEEEKEVEMSKLVVRLLPNLPVRPANLNCVGRRR